MVTITEKAAARVKLLAQKQGKPPRLRVKVGPGGCSGLSYQFEIGADRAPEDIVFEGHGAAAMVDPRSDFFIGGSEIDYFESLMEAGFRVKNPQAKSACSCGTSFSV
ncbi:MAG: HesB/IscA family protein [Elusimicrobiota bacterium]